MEEICQIILQNKECRIYSKYYDKIYMCFIEINNDIFLLQNKCNNIITYNELKNIILYKIKILLDNVMNSKNEVICTIDMILKLPKQSNINNQYIDFNNIALHLEYLDFKLLELFEKCLIHIKNNIENRN